MAISPISSLAPADRQVRRYPGVESFADDDVSRVLFCGRDREKYDLLYQVLAERLVVLFARSGIGKSSIINAGVMQPLREKEFFPMVVRISGTNDDPLDSFYKGVKAACDRALERGEIDAFEPADPAEWNRTSLWHFIKTLYIWRGDKLLQPVVIIDQFEELFTLISEAPRAEFIDQLADLVRGTRPRDSSREPAHEESVQKEAADKEAEIGSHPPEVKVVLSIREDFLADLHELADRIPAILKSRFRLEALKVEQAKDAILKPAELDSPELTTPAFKWSDDALQCTLDFLRKRKSKDGGMEAGNAVEPFQLQLVCQFVEDLVQENNLRMVSADDLGGEEALQKVLAHFYHKSIGHLTRKFRGRRLKRRLENLCEKGLITGKGRRLLREESTIAERDRISPAILTEMVQLRLIRKEPRVGDNYYELTHDTLIAPILANRLRRERRRRRWIGGVVGIPLLAALALVLIAYIDTVRDERWEMQFSAQEKVLSGVASNAEVFEKIQTVADIAVNELTGGEVIGRRLVQGTLTDINPQVGKVLQKVDLDLSGSHDRITVSLNSPDFDGFLMVVDSAGEPHFYFERRRGQRPQLTFSDDGPGTAHVIVSSVEGQSIGTYELDVDWSVVDTVTDIPLAQIANSGDLRVGSVIRSELAASDMLANYVVQRWELQLDEFEQVSVSLSSLDFDTYLFLRTSDGTLLTNDDSGGGTDGTDSMISFIDGPGPVQVVASSFSGTSTGEYQIDVGIGSELGVADIPPSKIPTAGELIVGSQIDSELAVADTLASFVVQKWDLLLDERERVAVSLSSSDFDSYLVVRTSDDQLLTNDDDESASLDSMLSFVDGPGIVQIIASGYSGDAIGDYQISVDVGSASSVRSVGDFFPSEIPTAGTVVVDTEREGVLTDASRLGNFVVQRWELPLEEQHQVSVSLSSFDFDTYLVVHTPSGQMLTNDDFGDGTDSMLTFTDGPGTVDVIVASYDGDATGEYVLDVAIDSLLNSRDLVPSEIPATGALTIGSGIDGELTASDSLGFLIVDRWELQLEERQEISVSLSSFDFDTYLVVHTPDGRMLTNDDFQDGTDSFLSFIDGPGTVEIVVSSFDDVSIGNYRLEVD